MRAVWYSGMNIVCLLKLLLLTILIHVATENCKSAIKRELQISTPELAEIENKYYVYREVIIDEYCLYKHSVLFHTCDRRDVLSKHRLVYHPLWMLMADSSCVYNSKHYCSN